MIQRFREFLVLIMIVEAHEILELANLGTFYTTQFGMIEIHACMYSTYSRLVWRNLRQSQKFNFRSSLGKRPRIQIVNQTRLKCSERYLLTFRLNNSSCLD